MKIGWKVKPKLPERLAKAGRGGGAGGRFKSAAMNFNGGTIDEEKAPLKGGLARW